MKRTTLGLLVTIGLAMLCFAEGTSAQSVQAQGDVMLSSPSSPMPHPRYDGYYAGRFEVRSDTTNSEVDCLRFYPDSNVVGETFSSEAFSNSAHSADMLTCTNIGVGKGTFSVIGDHLAFVLTTTYNSEPRQYAYGGELNMDRITLGCAQLVGPYSITLYDNILFEFVEFAGAPFVSGASRVKAKE